MADLEELIEDEVAQMGAGAVATGVASAAGLGSSPGVSAAIGALATTKAGATLAAVAAAVGAVPLLVIGGGLGLIGIGLVRVLKK